jgi:4-alpha-glucanotransferase
MKSINIVFAIHNHQPIGNFEKVFEDALQRSYKPFLDVLERHPNIKFTQHWTGTLLEWLVRKHPEIIERMKMMVLRGQLELLSGAYYEAVLAIVPEADRIGQIRKLTDYIEKIFHYPPRGMWLAERVWEQPLVSSLVKAGIEFVMVDDTHFKHAGLQDDQLRGYYITEELGSMLKVVPIDKMLRYAVPFRTVEESLHYLQTCSSDHGTSLVVHADDGEKFGVWPKTYNHVYGQGWLESFCRMLDQQGAWVKTTHLGTVTDLLPPLGRIYLPTASYAEMMKWALNPTAFVKLERFEQQLKDAQTFEENTMFVRGGFWRNFLAKYPESNHMHKKMLRVASRAWMLAQKEEVDADTIDHIWAGQCNDAYWHGVFGGLYLPNLRFPVYRNLLQAEVNLDRQEKLPPLRIEETDFDCDGFKEVLLESDVCNLYFKPDSGASLVELDYKPIAFNLLDVVSRREEGYHRRLLIQGNEFKEKTTVHDGVLVKEEGLEKYLHFDWYRRASLLDHFLGNSTTLESFARCKHLELGDFVNQPYTTSIFRAQNEIDITFRRDGALWFGGRPHRVAVQKVVRYGAGGSGLTVNYTIVNKEQTPVDIWFGVEFNVGLMAGDAHDRYYKIEDRPLADAKLRSTGEENNVATWSLVDEWLGIEVAFTVRTLATLWRFPIETVSLSEEGFERLYQSSVVFPHWKVLLEREFRVTIEQSITRL